MNEMMALQYGDEDILCDPRWVMRKGPYQTQETFDREKALWEDYKLGRCKTKVSSSGNGGKEINYDYIKDCWNAAIVSETPIKKFYADKNLEG